MLCGNVMTIPLTVGLINKISLHKMSYFTESYSHNKNKIKVKIDLSKYETKSDLKGATTIHISKFDKKNWFRLLKIRCW